MSAPTGPSDDDAYWRRPDHDAPAVPPPPGRPAPPPYEGPPPSTPPPAGWRPPFVSEPVAPRQLPPQDTAAIEESERHARTVTYGIGMVAAALMVVTTCLLCSRLLF